MENNKNQYRFSQKLIVLDGPDGCGKSTQTALLAEYLAKTGAKVKTFRDPGSTFVSEKIRNILLDNENKNMCARTELLLYMASRAQLWYEYLSPALKEGFCVILDRWISSSCAYQGFAGKIGIDKVLDIATHSLERIWPDATLILDVDLNTAKGRMTRILDRMEQKDAEYHKNVRAGFLELAETRQDIIVIDATASVQSIHEKIISALENMFDFEAL